MLVEEWRDIKGYEGLYRISNYGNVLGLTSGKLLKHSKAGKYVVCGLWKNNVFDKKYIHSLVYSNFIGNIKGVIDFKDGDYTNCMIDNLIDVSKTFVFKKSSCFRILDTKTMKMYDSINDLSNEIGVSQNNISTRLKNKSHKYSRYKIIDNV